MPKKTLYIWLIGFLGFTQLMGQSSDSILTNAERMPYFPGCTAYKVDSKERRQCSNQTVKAYIFNHLIYPQAAKEADIEGAVYVRFTVDEMGYVRNPQVLKEIGGGCGAAAIEVINNMPQWEPAYHNGKNVKVALELPIHFYFKDTPSTSNNNYTLALGQIKEEFTSRKSLQENLSEQIVVFDNTGAKVTISELHFIVNKGNRIIQKSSNGKVTTAMKKIVKKLRKGHRLSIIATIQKKGQFIEVTKDFTIIKN